MDRHGPGAAAGRQGRCDLGSQNNSIVTRRSGRSDGASTARPASHSGHQDPWQVCVHPRDVSPQQCRGGPFVRVGKRRTNSRGLAAPHLVSVAGRAEQLPPIAALQPAGSAGHRCGARGAVGGRRRSKMAIRPRRARQGRRRPFGAEVPHRTQQTGKWRGAVATRRARVAADLAAAGHVGTWVARQRSTHCGVRADVAGRAQRLVCAPLVRTVERRLARGLCIRSSMALIPAVAQLGRACAGRAVVAGRAPDWRAGGRAIVSCCAWNRLHGADNCRGWSSCWS